MNKTTLSLAVAGLLVSAGVVSAATVTEDLQVTASVVATCSVGAPAPMEFGVYDLSGAAVDGGTSVDVTCTNGHAYDVGLGVGQNLTRQMVNGGDTEAFLDYELYTDSGRTAVWGAVGTESIGNGTAQTHAIYGQIASGQFDATAGAYTDTVLITVTY